MEKHEVECLDPCSATPCSASPLPRPSTRQPNPPLPPPTLLRGLRRAILALLPPLLHLSDAPPSWPLSTDSARPDSIISHPFPLRLALHASPSFPRLAAALGFALLSPLSLRINERSSSPGPESFLRQLFNSGSQHPSRAPSPQPDHHPLPSTSPPPPTETAPPVIMRQVKQVVRKRWGGGESDCRQR